MGNLIYPALPGLSYPVGRAVVPPPVRIRTTPSQREFRGRDATLPRYQYSLSYEFLKAGLRGADLSSLLGFYNQVGGPFDSWLFSDPDDNTATAQQFGVGDGTTAAWQLVRGFGGFAEAISALQSVPVISMDGQPANMLMNSSFEARTAGNQPYGYAEYNNTAISTTYLAPAGRTGGLAYGLRANAATTNTFGLYAGFGLNDFGITKGGVRGGWSSGVAYTISYYARKVNGAGFNNMGMGWDTPPSSSVALANPILSTSWQRYVFVVSWTGATEILGSLYISISGTTATTDEIHIDDIQVVIASSAPAYVAGNQSYTLNNTTGLVTFDAPPAASSVLSWSGSFYRRCRFLGDRIDTQKFMADLFEARRVEFIGVKA